jgi:site-specific recombinase XerD
LLRLALKRWPPEPATFDAGELLCREVYGQYRTWLQEERGLAIASISALMWEARYFCSWYIGRACSASFADLSIRDVDSYFEMRARGLRRKSLKDVAERLRSLMRHLHRTGRIAVDLAPQIIAPMLYAYETIPSTLSSDQIATVLKSARKDQSPMGLRDYAILQLLSTYGLRAGEITHLKLNDIDWRADTLHIHHSKTGAHSLLPLLEPVGEALINYLRDGRPQTDTREIFIRSRAPYRRMVRIYSEVLRRMEAAGVKPSGKRGPHIFRHARAVSLLRASVPRKVIGDVLGHRSTEATIPYLKLATEDLRAIALEIPGLAVRS